MELRRYRGQPYKERTKEEETSLKRTCVTAQRERFRVLLALSIWRARMCVPRRKKETASCARETKGFAQKARIG